MSSPRQSRKSVEEEPITPTPPGGPRESKGETPSQKDEKSSPVGIKRFMLVQSETQYDFAPSVFAHLWEEIRAGHSSDELAKQLLAAQLAMTNKGKLVPSRLRLRVYEYTGSTDDDVYKKLMDFLEKSQRRTTIAIRTSTYMEGVGGKFQEVWDMNDYGKVRVSIGWSEVPPEGTKIVYGEHIIRLNDL